MKQKNLLFALVIVSAVGQPNARSQGTNLNPVELPARYFQLLEAGIARVKNDWRLSRKQIFLHWKRSPDGAIFQTLS